MPYFPLKRGEGESSPPFPHATTHHAGGTDAISAEAIGARSVGVDIDWSEITGIPPENGETVTYNIINSSPAFVEEFDDFLQNAAAGKLGWTTDNQNGYSFTVPGNNFSGAKGVFGCGIRGTNQVVGDYSRNRLGNFPIIPQLSEGYQNLEIQSVIAIENVAQSSVEWSSRFGLLDGAHSNIDGSNWSILICAEFFDGAYNWIALWRSGNNITEKRLITPVVTSSTEMFSLKIFINCETFQITFTVNDVVSTVNIPQSIWGFGAMAPVFQIQRQGISGSAANRRIWGDKFLIRENVTDELPPASPEEVEWADILSKPTLFGSDWDLVDSKPTVFPPSTHEHNWQEISGMPSYATTADIDSAIQWHRNSPDGTQHRWDQISNTPDFAAATNPSFSFLTGWSDHPGWEVSCWAIGRLVKWGGMVRRTTTSGNTIIGAMSGYYRPVKPQMFMSWAYWGNAYQVVRLDVNDFGSVSVVYPIPPASAITWVSLAPICYYASA